MSKTLRKKDNDNRPWKEVLSDTKRYLARKQEEEAAEEEVRNTLYGITEPEETRGPHGER